MSKLPEEVIINKEYLTPAYCCCFVYKMSIKTMLPSRAQKETN